MAGINNTVPNPYLAGAIQPPKKTNTFNAGLVTTNPQSTMSLAPTSPAPAPAPNPFKVVSANPTSLGVAPMTAPQSGGTNALLQSAAPIKGILTPPKPATVAAPQQPVTPTPAPTPAPAPTPQGPAFNPVTPANPYVAPLAQLGQQDSAEVIAARKALQDLENEYATKAAGIEGTPGSNLTLASGAGGLLARQFAAKQTAAQQALASAIATQAQRGQFTQSAAALATPQVASPYGFFNPATGQFTQYGGGSGAGLAGAGAVQQQMSQGADVQSMTGLQEQARALATSLTTLIDSAGINKKVNEPLFQKFVGGVNAWLAGQQGDPQYQNFANLITEVSKRYASILNQAGGTPTDQSQISHAIVNGLAAGQDIKTVLESLDRNSTESIDALRKAAQSNAVTSPGGFQEGQKSSDGSLIFTGGQWKPA